MIPHKTIVLDLGNVPDWFPAAFIIGIRTKCRPAEAHFRGGADAVQFGWACMLGNLWAKVPWGLN